MPSALPHARSLEPHYSSIIAAARLPNSGFCEIAVNATLAFIEGAKPRDEVESALVIQMACTHSAAMAVLNRLGGGHGTDRGVAAMALPIAARLNGGSQIARVEHGRRADQGAMRSIPPVQFTGCAAPLPYVG